MLTGLVIGFAVGTLFGSTIITYVVNKLKAYWTDKEL